ncbi:hypothetical protein HMPREF1548_02116 [Clostridium sp. KLE 1755]|nr:hypothetical protein HMPREF1548_02116 [Clostridium sp. KLE 1755]
MSKTELVYGIDYCMRGGKIIMKDFSKQMEMGDRFKVCVNSKN